MSKNKGNNRSQAAPSVNPQGYAPNSEYKADPKSSLENAAKKKNTK
ncbi:small, acid-soluble spore protein L [Metabacillus arenae]|uniref:Small, acid-soluble spore protein L n=1 Tax=Metabacillus arenae TaxID=2771434 RepID=A0A926RX95_9BACI|nr:small, acid-soluble spore protein L [Metabacillus arenae]MBD1381633.1 small, acid-soluble spore protein L [Metabacillus arenae]